MNFEIISANSIDEYIGNINVIIIDLRSPYDYYKGHIPTAVNIPYRDFEKGKHGLAKNKTLIFYCERGSTSLILARDLSEEGYKVKSIYGGIGAYRGSVESR